MSVTFESTGQKYHFTRLYNIFKFYYEQNEKWKTIDNIDNIFDDSKNFFGYATTNLLDFINLRIINAKVSEFDFDSFFQTLESKYLSPNKYVFPFDAPEVGFLQNIAVKNKNFVIPAYNYIIDSNLNSNNKSNIQGYILAYEFQNKENSVLFNNRETEKRHLARLRADVANLTYLTRIFQRLSYRIEKLLKRTDAQRFPNLANGFINLLIYLKEPIVRKDDEKYKAENYLYWRNVVIADPQLAYNSSFTKYLTSI